MTSISGKYMWFRKLLKNMDEKQLTELFYDINDIDSVHRISECAFKFVLNNKLTTHQNPTLTEEYREHEAQDCRDRAADVNSNFY